MLNGAPLFKKTNIVILYWSLYSQFLKSLKNMIFNLNIFLCSLTSASGH
jgi:hypothetical protein